MSRMSSQSLKPQQFITFVLYSKYNLNNVECERVQSGWNIRHANRIESYQLIHWPHSLRTIFVIKYLPSRLLIYTWNLYLCIGFGIISWKAFNGIRDIRVPLSLCVEFCCIVFCQSLHLFQFIKNVVSTDCVRAKW